MKMIQKHHIICAGAVFLAAAYILSRNASLASNSPSDPCIWGNKEKAFTSPALSTTVEGFTPSPFNIVLRAKLFREEKGFGTTICSLKNPRWSADKYGTPLSGGEQIVTLVAYPDVPFSFYFEIESYGENDFLLIDDSKIDITVFVDAQTPTPKKAENDPGGGRKAKYVWYGAPKGGNPLQVSIEGAEGNKIQIQHRSGAVILRRVLDSAGNPVAITWNGVDLGFQMNHTVQKNQ